MDVHVHVHGIREVATVAKTNAKHAIVSQKAKILFNFRATQRDDSKQKSFGAIIRHFFSISYQKPSSALQPKNADEMREKTVFQA